jgi:hypothetical protein
MMSPIIEQERHGFWIAASFIVALLALVLAFSTLWRLNSVMVGSQMEIFALNSKIETLKGKVATPAAAPMSAAADAPK